MTDKIFGLHFEMQKDEIEKHCFGDCGKIQIGAIMTDFGSLLPCREEDCPHLDRQLDDPVGEVDGDNVYLRKLVEKEKK